MCQQNTINLLIEHFETNGMPMKISKNVQSVLRKKFHSNKQQNNQNEIILKNSINITTNDNNICAKCKLVIPVLHESNIILDQQSTFLCTNCYQTTMNNQTKQPSAYVNNQISNINKEITENDILAITTNWIQLICNQIYQLFERIQKSTTFRILTRTTQPAHVIALGILSFVLFAIWPNILQNNHSNVAVIDQQPIPNNHKKSGLALVAYLAAFATHFGAQIWMTFVSGLSLYFALPRHTFGLCQQILFPKYFALNSMLSICTLIMYIKMIEGRWELSSYIQVIALTICAVIEVAVRLYLAPPLLRLMTEKHKFEMNIGSGQEIGRLDQGDLIKCPHYQKIHKSFRRIHMTVAMGNMTVLVCTFLHLNYLASKISVS